MSSKNEPVEAQGDTPPATLTTDIQNAEQELEYRWNTTKGFLETLQGPEGSEKTIRATLAATRSALQAYGEAWETLSRMYDADPYYHDRATQKKMSYLEKNNLVNLAIAAATEKACSLAIESASSISQRSGSSKRSSRSKTSASTHLSAKAQAAASAAAAVQNALFEEAIAKRTAEMLDQQTVKELEYAKREAENQLLQTKHDLEQRARAAAAEADIKVLQARQTAAIEKARLDALTRAEVEERTNLTTTPEQTANDHALNFRTRHMTDLPGQLRASAPEFTPSDDRAYDTQPPVSEPSPDQLRATEIPPMDRPKSSLVDLTKEISETLARQRQPAHEPEIYRGDPIMFQPWKSAFTTMISQARTPPAQKLAFLAKYTAGEVRELVDRFRHRHVADPQTAYEEAWQELQERFGNKTKIASQIIQRLTSFPKIKGDERRKFQDFADLCVDASAQMSDLTGLHVLNYPYNLHPLLEKLPPYIHNKWREQVSNYKKLHECYPPFQNLATFLKDKARASNDPDLYPPSTHVETERANKGKPNTSSQPPKPRLHVMATKGPNSPAAKPTSDPQKCLFHDRGGHTLADCVAFRRKPLPERREFCKQKGLCFKCGQNHLARDCQSEVKCVKCSSSFHATFMHPPTTQNGGEPAATVPENTPETTEANTKCTKFTSCAMARSCSKIVLVKVHHRSNPSVTLDAYAVLDDQSNACLGDPKLFDALNIDGPPFEYELSTCGGRRISTQGRRASGLVMKSLEGNIEHLPTVIENDNIPSDRDEIPSPDLCRKFQHLSQIAGKIPNISEDVDVLLLIGRNCPEPLKVRESRNGPKGTPWAQRTTMGWTVSGRMCSSSITESEHVSTHRTTLTSAPSPVASESYFIYPTVCENHIKTKDVPSTHRNMCSDVFVETSHDDNKALSVEDQRFIQILSDNVHTNGNGNLEFPLPFKTDPTYLPNNRPQAEARLRNLLRTLNRKPELMKEYRAFLGKILDMKHATPVPIDEPTPATGTTWYLPHFPVRHPKKPDIRVVFDASSEFNGISLNQVLLQGPDQMNTLLGILLRFRVDKVAVMGDVEKMFHNFHVTPNHRNFLRFLWFQDNDPEKPIVDHRMNVHLFGNISSPAVATFGIRMIARECESTHGKDMSEFIHRDFYVDDGLTSQPDAEMAISLILRTKEAFASKNLRFHKIVSNNTEVMSALPEGDRAKDVKNLDFNHDRLPTQRSLGVHWALEKDTFTFIVNLPERPFTRRGVLSIASSIFDPLGLVTPVTIEGKLILREVMTETKGTNVPQDLWDRPLPETSLSRWNRWRDSLCELENVYIQRCYKPPASGEIKRREVHVFCDASEIAMGAVCYLRLVDACGQPHLSLLLAKAKLAPAHAVSIPRLELCAAVLATTLSRTAEAELQGRVAIDETVFYSDSQVVLGYIANESKRFHVYVANRVHKIHAASKPSQWHHVSSGQNPADLASRSVPAGRLNDTNWFRGPDFLWQPGALPAGTTSANTGQTYDKDDPEVRKQVSTSVTNVEEEANKPTVQDDGSLLGCARFSRFSSWPRLERAVGHLIRKIQTFKAVRDDTSATSQDEAQRVSSNLSRAQLQQAERAIFRAIQSESFSDEVQTLKKARTDPNSIISKKSPLVGLAPFLDDDGILRVGGRLKRGNFDLGVRHPIVLPKGNHVSRLLVEHFHREVRHQGRHLTTGAVRSAGLWILGLHKLVRSVINQCTTCRRLRGKPLNQIMGELPEDRLTATPPFTTVGMDVFGPWSVVSRKTRGGTSDSKRWAVIFACLYSGAIHLEVIESLDASAFISAYRRLVAIRGPVARLRCDRGTNFVGAKNDLDNALGEMDRERAASFLSSQRCEWVFNPPHASHFGGIWERQIGTVRRVLDAMFLDLGKHQLTHEILVTFLAEAAAIVNSRPLCCISPDADDPQPLNPSMLLTHKTQQLQPLPGNFVRQDEYGRRRWRRVQYLADQFWVRWKREYLQSLQPRRKWHDVKQDLGNGDVVLLRDKELPRCQWPLARVVKVHPSEDGRVRKAEVTVCTNGTKRTYLRPISELVLIDKAPVSD